MTWYIQAEPAANIYKIIMQGSRQLHVYYSLSPSHVCPHALNVHVYE